MSVADQMLAQHESQVAKVGQWVAIRRYAGTTVKTYTDTPARAYVLYLPAKEFVGAVVQNYLTAITLVDTLVGLLPVTTNDRLVTEFFGHDDLGTTPGMNEESHVSGGKQFAINTAAKRDPGGKLIALEIHAVG